ncbi:MAG: hypothetical protein ACRCT8_09340 [Lacipirellulaceae bacterium]
MSDEQQPHGDVERRFRSALAPVAAQIDDRAVWYAAGHAAGRGERGGVRAYAAAATLASAILGFALWRGDAPAPAARGLSRPAPPPAATQLAPHQIVWTAHGVRLRADGTLEDPPREPLTDAAPHEFRRAEPATSRRLLRELLSTDPTETPPREPEARVVPLLPRGVA